MKPVSPDTSAVDHEHSTRHTAATRSTWVSVAVNSVLATLQIIIGVFSHSQSLIADGLHSLTDLIADFVVLAATRISRVAADDNHPYGHARFETVASMVLGVLLIVAGAGMLWIAAHRIADPSTIPTVHVVALWTALAAIICKESLFRYMLAVAKRVNSSMLVANAWHARADAASSLVVALGIGGNLLGYPFLDPLAAALVGFMICRTGGKFAWEALAQLTDQGLSSEEVDAIRATFLTVPGVENVHDLRTRSMGDDVLIDAHLLVDGRLSVSEGHFIAANARSQVLAGHKALDVLVHIDSEDDDGIEGPIALPPRDEILAQLQQALVQEGFQVPATTLPTVQIHYLNHSVDLDLFLHDESTATDTALRPMRAAIQRLKNAMPSLRHVRVWRPAHD